MFQDKDKSLFPDSIKACAGFFFLFLDLIINDSVKVTIMNITHITPYSIARFGNIYKCVET